MITHTKDAKDAKDCREQTELPLFQEPKGSDNVEWLIRMLQECGMRNAECNGWMRAAELLGLAGQPVTENNKRKVRAWADASEGRVCGHQKGYKLTTSMTHEEYRWWRNEALKMKNAIESRVIETDKVFYAKSSAGRANC